MTLVRIEGLFDLARTNRLSNIEQRARLEARYYQSTMAAPPRILVVDDAPAIRRVFTRTLTESGMHVVEADNGRLALQLALEHLPHAIVSDIEMAEMDGVELCRRVRANDATKSVKILIVSGNLSQHGFEALEAGCDAVLEKPCPPRLLVDTVRWLLGTSKES